MNSDGCVKTMPPDGVIDYRPAALSRDEADALFSVLRAEANWQQRAIQMFGRRVMQPRLICFMGDVGVDYCYSGDRLSAPGWHPAVLELRDRLTDVLNVPFNSVLVNAYRDGRDSMGWHADDEPELGRCPTIASISLGAVRRFRLRSKHDRETLTLEPEHGSLIVMRGDLQHHWQHQVPRTARKVGWRINLTFRQIESPDFRCRR